MRNQFVVSERTQEATLGNELKTGSRRYDSFGNRSLNTFDHQIGFVDERVKGLKMEVVIGTHIGVSSLVSDLIEQCGIVHVFTAHITLLNTGSTKGITTNGTTGIESGLSRIVNTIDGQVYLGSIGKG